MITTYEQSTLVLCCERLICRTHVLQNIKTARYFSELKKSFFFLYKNAWQRNCVDKIPVYWQTEELKQNIPPPLLLLCQAVAVCSVSRQEFTLHAYSNFASTNIVKLAFEMYLMHQRKLRKAQPTFWQRTQKVS